jgi:hypothetical protein
LLDSIHLDTPEAQPESMEGCGRGLDESKLAGSQTGSLSTATGNRLKSGEKLDDGYVYANLPALWQQLYHEECGRR